MDSLLGGQCKDIFSSDMRENMPYGTDWFGVEWEDFIPVPGKYILEDVADWREKVHFPNLDAVDWAAAAKKDLAGVNCDEYAVWVPLRTGPFERMHSFM